MDGTVKAFLVEELKTTSTLMPEWNIKWHFSMDSICKIYYPCLKRSLLPIRSEAASNNDYDAIEQSIVNDIMKIVTCMARTL